MSTAGDGGAGFVYLQVSPNYGLLEKLQALRAASGDVHTHLQYHRDGVAQRSPEQALRKQTHAAQKETKKPVLKWSVYHSFNQTEVKHIIEVYKSLRHFGYGSRTICTSV